MLALEEVQPAFGVSEEELQGLVQNGIIHYDESVEVIIHESIISHPSIVIQMHHVLPPKAHPALTDHHPTPFRTSSKMPDCSWNRCGHRPEHLSCPCCYMASLGPGRRPWQLRLRRTRNIRLSNWCHQIRWLDFRSSKRCKRSIRYSTTATRALLALL